MSIKIFHFPHSFEVQSRLVKNKLTSHYKKSFFSVVHFLICLLTPKKSRKNCKSENKLQSQSKKFSLFKGNKCWLKEVKKELEK